MLLRSQTHYIALQINFEKKSLHQGSCGMNKLVSFARTHSDISKKPKTEATSSSNKYAEACCTYTFA